MAEVYVSTSIHTDYALKIFLRISILNQTQEYVK